MKKAAQPQSKAVSKVPSLLITGLLVATAGVFWPVITCDFVNYDDLGYVVNNQDIQHGFSVESIAWAFTTGACSNWHPLTWLSHILDIQLFGLKPGGHHLTSLMFHLANVALLFFVLKKMTGTLWRSAFVAALFALHPLRVESVAWVSERKDVLSTFFLMLTLWAYAHYADRAMLKRRLYYALSLVFFALGLMSKPMLVTLPFVMLLLDIWPLNRLDVSALWKRTAASDSNNNPALANLKAGFGLVLEKVPFMVLALVSSVVTFFVQRSGGAVSSLAGLGITARVENALVSYVRYIGKTCWPSKLSILYPHPGDWPLWAVAGSTLILVSVTIFVILVIRSRPYLAVGWFLFLGMLVPTIGLVQVGIQSMADRYTYVPIIGLFFIVVWGAVDLMGSRDRARTILAPTGACAIAACMVLTSIQVGYWKNSEALFLHAIEVTDKNYLACNNLGYYYSNKGELAKAMDYYKRSLSMNPGYEEAHNNLGYALAGLGRYEEAIAEYLHALRIKPNLVEAHNNLGNALSNVGKIDEAIAAYLQALKLNPKHGDAHNNYGIALAMQGKLNEAIEEFHVAVRCKPNYASAHSNLGNAYAAQNKLDEALKEYNESLKISPNDAQAHNNLANVLAQQGKLEDAIAHYSLAIRLKPENPEAHFNLGFSLSKAGRLAEAENHYVEAIRQKPDYRQAHEQLQVIRAKLKSL